MKNKKIWITVIFAAVCACVILGVILISNNRRNHPGDDPDEVESFSSLGEAVEWAGFPLQCTDRLRGILVTGYTADKTTITVNYGQAGYITKRLVISEAGDSADVTEASAGNDAETSEEVRTEH